MMLYCSAIEGKCQGKTRKYTNGHQKWCPLNINKCIWCAVRMGQLKNTPEIQNCNAEDTGGKEYTENTQKVYTFSVILSYHVMTDKLRTRITVRVTTNLRGTNRRLCAVDRAAFGTAIVRGAKVFTAFCTQHTDPFLSWGHTPCVRALFINP